MASPNIARQYELLGLARLSYSYELLAEREENLQLMRLLEEH